VSQINEELWRRTKLQEKYKKIENLQKILEELQEVSQINEELSRRDLNFLREKIRELQKPRTNITPQNAIHKGSNVNRGT
jgi:Fic family protein